MKKEYYWFLILILAAAVVTGSTLGLLTNFKYISQQSKIRLQENKAVESNTSELNQPSLTNQTLAANNESSSANDTPQIAANGTTDTTVMMVSQAEKDEIDIMLNAVENINGTDYRARIRSFQEKNALSITGLMDSQTLNALINQATIQRSLQHLND